MDEITQEQLDFLATKCMGWARGMGSMRSDQESAPCWRSKDGKVQTLWCTWRPARKWPQCGALIDAMLEKGWRLVLDPGPGRKEAVFYWRDETSGYCAVADTATEAITMAAVSALEAADEQ